MNKTNYRIDVFLFLCLFLLLFPEGTGVVFHILLGLSLTLAVAVHLILHRKWIIAALKNSLPASNQRGRRLRILNVFLAVCFSLTVYTGILNALSLGQEGVSSTAETRMGGFQGADGNGLDRGRDGFEGGRGQAGAGFHFHAFHHLFAILTFIGVLFHLGLHWNWVRATTRQFFSASAPKPNQSLE